MSPQGPFLLDKLKIYFTDTLTNTLRSPPLSCLSSGSSDHTDVVRPITWVEGDDSNNIDELLRTSYANTVRLFPEIKDVTYSFDKQRFERDGVEFTDFAGIVKRGTDRLRERGLSKILSADRGGVAGKKDERPPVGSATLKRAAVLNTVARKARGDRGGELLAAVGRVVSGGLENTPAHVALSAAHFQQQARVRNTGHPSPGIEG